MLSLVYGLGPNTTLGRNLDPYWWWTQDTELLASLIELLDRHDRHTLLVAQVKEKTLGEPIRIRRPYKRDKEKKESKNEKEVKKKNSSLDQLKAMLGNQLVVKPFEKES